MGVKLFGWMSSNTVTSPTSHPLTSMSGHDRLEIQNLDRHRCQAKRITNSSSRRLRAGILLDSSGVGKTLTGSRPIAPAKSYPALRGRRATRVAPRGWCPG